MYKAVKSNLRDRTARVSNPFNATVPLLRVSELYRLLHLCNVKLDVPVHLEILIMSSMNLVLNVFF